MAVRVLPQLRRTPIPAWWQVRVDLAAEERQLQYDATRWLYGRDEDFARRCAARERLGALERRLMT